MMMEKISVIIPVYNVERYLDRALQSVCGQSYRNLQILIVDDGSADNSGKICEEWKKKDKRITVIHQENAGVSAARNLGLDMAEGQYVMFVDADDWMDADMIEKLYQLLQEYHADVSMCAYEETDEESVRVGQKLPETGETEQVVCANGKIEAGLQLLLPWSVYGKLYRRELLGNIRLEPYKIAEDILFNTEIICQKYPECVVSTNEKMYHYFVRRDSAVRQTYEKKYMEGVRAEERCYDRLIQISPKFGDINIVGCSVSMFFERIAELPAKERRKYRDDYRWCKKNAKQYRKALCDVSDRHRKVSGMLKVYVPDLYLWTLIIRKRFSDGRQE